MKEFIAQKDEVCQTCGGELPKGSVIYIDSENSNETVICQDCIEEFEFDSNGGADRW